MKHDLIPQIKMLIDSEADFTVENTSGFYKVHFMGAKFEHRLYGKKLNTDVLSCVAMLKNELKKVTFEHDAQEEYFAANFRFDFDLSKSIWCIDISSAYITILKNDKMISKALFERINKLPKADRLRVVGSLATKKYYNTYEKGVLVDSRMKANEFSKFFFYCVSRTFETMNRISHKLGNNFILSWVDCVFFTCEGNVNYITDYLKSNGLKSKLERCYVISGDGVSATKNSLYYTFHKSGDLKEYVIPVFNPLNLLHLARVHFIKGDFDTFNTYISEYSASINSAAK